MRQNMVIQHLQMQRISPILEIRLTWNRKIISNRRGRWCLFYLFVGYMFCFLFKKISLSQSMLRSIGPIFTILSLNGRYLFVDDWPGPLFLIPQGTLQWPPIFSKICELTFLQHAGILKYRSSNFKIFSGNIFATLCPNLTKISPETVSIILYER